MRRRNGRIHVIPTHARSSKRLRRDLAMGHPSPPATQRSPTLPLTSSPAVLTTRGIVSEVSAHNGPVKQATATEISKTNPMKAVLDSRSHALPSVPRSLRSAAP